MTLSEAIEGATQIVRCYPNGGQNAGKGYIGALAAMLGKYPRQVSLRCVEPTSGVVLECKFLPTVADLVEWLERESQPLYRQSVREDRIAQQFADRERKERTPESIAQIEIMRLDFMQRMQAPESPIITAERAQKTQQSREQRLKEVHREWASQGEDVPTIGGIPVSRELVESMAAE